MRLHIEFTRSRTWSLPWGVLAFIAAIAMGASAAKHRATQRALMDVQIATSELAAKSQAIRFERDRAAQAAAHDANAGQLARAAALLQFDWNPVFATIENVQEPGARLVSMSATAGEEVRLEYQVQSIEVASRLTAQLNGGLAAPAWRLERVVAAPTALSTTGTSDLRATWAARMTHLR